jgi:general secretion pathway protein A
MKTNKSVIQPVGEWVDLGEFLNNLNIETSRQTAVKAAIQLWNTSGTIQSALDSLADNASFFRLATKQNGLHCQRVLGDLNLVWKLNLPAILELHLFEDLSPAYLTLSKIENGKITLIGENDSHEMFVKPDDILTYWKGIAYIPWKDFSGFSSDIPGNASEDSIVTLKMLLKEIGFDYLDLAPAYDQQTELAVKEIQQKHGVPADGIVGPLTKIILYNEKKSLSIPHIR